jgi:hypothetical protein
MNIKAYLLGAGMLLAAVGVAATGTDASAAPVGLSGPIQSYDPPFGSAHRTAVETYLEGLTGKDVIYLGRLDSGGSVEYGSALAGTGATLTGTGLSGQSGTWTFNPGTSSYIVAFLEINAGSKGLLYDVDPDAYTGFWDTNDIVVGRGNHPDLSHLDFWGLTTTGGGGPGGGDIPEPGTLALLGTALAGLGAVTRRKRKSA